MSKDVSPSEKRGSADYEVGYGKPPAKHQFQKGRSGNPRGRPKKVLPQMDPVADNFAADVVMAEAMRPVRITENGRVVEITALEATMRTMIADGLKGNQRARERVLAMTEAAQNRTLEGRQAFYQVTLAYLADARAKTARAHAKGLPEPEFVVHPDDLQPVPRTLEIRTNGPTNAEERRQWTMMRARAADLEPERQRLLAMLAQHAEHAPEIERQLKMIETIRQQTDSMFPDEATRRRPGFDLQAHRAETDHVFARKRKKPKGPPPSPS